MSVPAGYGYAQGDLLEQPAVYSFSRFGGTAFLDAWRAQRLALLDLRGVPTPSVASADAPTDLLLQQLLDDLPLEPRAPGALQVLARLLQRFEVTKRLHAAYNERWRPVDPAAYRTPERYLRFAEALELAYARSSALPWLNGLLKAMDTLSSLAPQFDADQVARLQRLVRREAAFIEGLAGRREVRA